MAFLLVTGNVSILFFIVNEKLFLLYVSEYHIVMNIIKCILLIIREL